MTERHKIALLLAWLMGMALCSSLLASAIILAGGGFPSEIQPHAAESLWP